MSLYSILKNGQIRSRGHVCSFVQDISSVCTELPRLPDDVQFVKVVKKYLQEGGGISSKMFTVRKKAVLDALKWLKEYNVEYSNIEIKESNLDWIENKNEQELPANLIEMDNNKSGKNSPASVDMGPSESQTYQDYWKNLMKHVILKEFWEFYQYLQNIYQKRKIDRKSVV